VRRFRLDQTLDAPLIAGRIRFRASAVVALVVVAGFSSVGRAQDPVAVNGVAYDSLRGAPLDRARIMIAGTTRSTTSDARGRFRFDSLAPGPYTFVLEHASLDSIGFSEWIARVTIRGGDEPVRVTIPSFARLWAVACGPSKPPRDSGLIFGTVRATGRPRPVARARVSLSWTELAGDKKTGIVQHRVGGEVVTDSTGSYTVCGVPIGVPFRLVAEVDSMASGVLDLPTRSYRVQRRDLLLGTTAQRGTVVGTVRDATGQPVRGARVLAPGLPETRSGVEGEFVIRDVASGTRQVEVLAIGAVPTSAVVDVLANDTARINVRLPKVTPLDTMHVRAVTGRQLRALEIADRAKLGGVKFMDSLDIERHANVANAVTDITAFRCGNAPVLIVDGLEIKREDVRSELRLLGTHEVGVMEFYIRNGPVQFTRKRDCVLYIWTRRWLR
jgi:hypothetical protein